MPESRQARTVQLLDLEPVPAGVTGEDVFRVTAERREGEPASVLPAPIGDAEVRGFAFTFGLDEVERLRLFDVDGDELDSLAFGR